MRQRDDSLIRLQEKGYTVIPLIEEEDKENAFHERRLLHVVVLDEKLSPQEGHVVLITILHDRVRKRESNG